jgi:hypothetical protein
MNFCTFSSPFPLSLSSYSSPSPSSQAALSCHILELATEPGGVESLSVNEWARVSLSLLHFHSISEVLFL